MLAASLQNKFQSKFSTSTRRQGCVSDTSEENKQLFSATLKVPLWGPELFRYQPGFLLIPESGASCPGPQLCRPLPAPALRGNGGPSGEETTSLFTLVHVTPALSNAAATGRR